MAQRHRVEQLMPLRGRKEEHVVGWSRVGCAAGNGSDLLEEGVGLRKVDHTVDAHLRRAESGAADRDDVTGSGVQVGRRLLREEHSVVRSRKVPQLVGKVCPVVAGDAEDDAGSGDLRGATGGRAQTGRLGELDGCRRGDAGMLADAGQHRARIRARRHLYLPVDGDGRHRPLCHRSLAVGDEGTDRRDQADGQRDTDGDDGQPPGAPTQQI